MLFKVDKKLPRNPFYFHSIDILEGNKMFYMQKKKGGAWFYLLNIN